MGQTTSDMFKDPYTSLKTANKYGIKTGTFLFNVPFIKNLKDITMATTLYENIIRKEPELLRYSIPDWGVPLKELLYFFCLCKIMRIETITYYCWEVEEYVNTGNHCQKIDEWFRKLQKYFSIYGITYVYHDQDDKLVGIHKNDDVFNLVSIRIDMKMYPI